MAKATLKIPELLKGRPKRAEIEGKGVLVARVGNGFYAIGDRCAHLGMPSLRERLQATIVTCPCHGSKFDITNGKVVAWVGKYSTFGKLTLFMKRDEPVYKVTVEGDEITISD
ncbi:MAG: Rieske (2Fe-2S) protein [Gammaproteobacteria bacterium]